MGCKHVAICVVLMNLHRLCHAGGVSSAFTAVPARSAAIGVVQNVGAMASGTC